LEQTGIPFDKRPYVPHVTLLRKAGRGPEKGGLPGAEWTVKEFVLVRSVPDREGAAYEVIGRWSLEKETG
jgi:2'-5' RNA ligase